MNTTTNKLGQNGGMSFEEYCDVVGVLGIATNGSRCRINIVGDLYSENMLKEIYKRLKAEKNKGDESGRGL